MQISCKEYKLLLYLLSVAAIGNRFVLIIF